MRLQDKVAIVTGAASGIGLAAVRRFELSRASKIASDLHTELEGFESAPPVIVIRKLCIS